MVDFILLVFLTFLLVGALPIWPYSRAFGLDLCRGVGLVLLIVLVLSLMRLIF
jgi:hypothetical protein